MIGVIIVLTLSATAWGELDSTGLPIDEYEDVIGNETFEGPLPALDEDKDTTASDSSQCLIYLEKRQKIDIEDYPYVVSLHNSDREYLCSGTIISPRVALTVHHCVSSYSARFIRANSEDLYSGGQEYLVQGIIKYPNASENRLPLPHDIALVVLETEIPNAQVLKLVDPNFKVAPGATVQALGAGRIEDCAEYYPSFLSKVNLQVTSDKDCREQYSSENWFCTESHTTYSCIGDGGAPVLSNGQLIGIVSHSKDLQRCNSGMPTANVNLTKYLSWIKSKMALFE
ncbi:hypothetical protein QAD02_016285 [Eretmocerus hayati]|uniref:Uncharacterized protein n=1 Tax=Eretmocerus hayati TaxID=131215 RepID=A0ACC2PAN3_9HYME|nr:hypothetical protein QAD02_016285 [Eretmocerus hayati]